MGLLLERARGGRPHERIGGHAAVLIMACDEATARAAVADDPGNAGGLFQERGAAV